ncbi:hypothetical protein RND81_01G036100 [Saponaria officinalis]|uniref:Uncharacterized protein n=1 Tax=Saponaria officinalis TaxID=3572 RepID=A0AAW1N5V7_SAPOF
MKKFKRCIMKLQRCIHLSQAVRPITSDGDGLVPKGHFAVLAGNGEEEQKRFVVELRYLKNQAVLKLLRKAEEEFGFEHEGALVVPCRPDELQKILRDGV